VSQKFKGIQKLKTKLPSTFTTAKFSLMVQAASGALLVENFHTLKKSLKLLASIMERHTLSELKLKTKNAQLESFAKSLSNLSQSFAPSHQDNLD